ncbi:hypothetical protein QF046_002699 [Microbacterium sp. W4I4]|nr:hypothetical protein [Microbacterium sp. W4I4]
MKSFATQVRRTRAQASGSLSRTHMIFDTE